MRYLLTIHSDENVKSTPEQQQKVWQDYTKYTEDLKKAGVMLAGDALLPTATGARIRVRDGKRSVVDGPFTDTKEVLGGYYILKVNSKEEAIEWGSKCPGAQNGTIDVVQIMDM
jgi:hypothetical protein